MEIKILQVFYDRNGLPYKDKERTVHYPITSGTFLGASNTTQIRFYYDQLDELNESTFVAVSKLPNGKIGSEILESSFDEELNENYVTLSLSQFYTQYKGDVYISLQGYQGGVRVEQDENNIYQIYGTPTIQATGSIRMYVAYAPTFIGSGQTENITLQQVLAELSTKLGIRQETLYVEELPTVGNPNVWYVINNDPNDATKANIYIWNTTTQTYVWVGDNTLNLGDYYTQEEGEQFESGINNRVTSVENELSSVASGSPKGVYATLSDLETAYPTGTNGIYVVSANGHWYYWNGSAWTDGGTYQATQIADESITYEKLNSNIVKHIQTINQWNELWELGSLAWNTGLDEASSTVIRSIGYIPVEPSTEYYMLGKAIVYCYNSNKEFVGTDGRFNLASNGGTFTTTSTTKYVRFRTDTSYGTTYNYDMGINYPSSVITYHTSKIGSLQYAVELLKKNIPDNNVSCVMARTSNEIILTKNNNDIIVTLPSSLKQIDYIKNGVFYTFNYTNTTLTIPNYSALIMNIDTSSFEIIDVNSGGLKPLENYLKGSYYILFYNDNGYPKGEWAKYYQYNKFREQISTLGHIKQTTKIMSRQGEGYGYPDNSIEGVSAALKDGYDNVRISVAHTSDNVIYCTHSYEMQNNSTLHVLTIGGDAYNDNVDINSSTSTFIDTLKYKGYTIPKLADMMNVISKNAKQVTFELKDSWDNTTLQQLINISKYYSVDVVFSMSIDSTPTLLTNLDDNLNIALIFHYTDALAQTLYNSYKNKTKSIRFDCYYEDTISFNSVITYIHPNCKLKLGGSSITSTQLKEYLTYLDVVEYSGKISEIGEL